MDLDQLTKIRNMLPGICAESRDGGLESGLGPEGKARRDYIAAWRWMHPGVPEPAWISRAKLIHDIFRYVLEGVTRRCGLSRDRGRGADRAGVSRLGR